MAARAFARVAPARAKLSLVVVVALAAALGLRLGDVQVVQGPVLSQRALAQHDETVDSFARRGAILDRTGGVLVRSLPSESISADPLDVADPHDAARKLSPILHKSVPDIETALRDRVQFRWLARKVSHDVAERVRGLDLAGIQTENEETGLRFVTSGRLASTVIGFTGTDENGLDGLEYSFDGLLRGKPGKMRIEADNFGHAIPFGEQQIVERAQPGRTLVTTIDPYLQFQAERLLRADLQRWHAPSGTVIVMNPWTGELLAVANMPDFDPSRFGTFSSDAWRDRAISDAYEPGSTFKLITVASALESGKVGAHERFPAHDVIEVGGRLIHNAEDGFMAGSGTSESVDDIIAYSHNVGAAEIGLRIGGRTLEKTIHDFGFGEPTQVGLPGENPGIVPPLDAWSGSSLATISFGQGVSVTPLAMARAYAAIANGGLLLRPRILRAIDDANGAPVYTYGTEVERRVMSAATAAQLRQYLREVVLRGTGHPAADVQGYTTAGKTGTAQVEKNGYYQSGVYVASFIGMIPADHPRYVILVKVDHPQGSIYGGVVAAPVFTELARAAMLHAGIMPAAPPRLVSRNHGAKVRD